MFNRFASDSLRSQDYDASHAATSLERACAPWVPVITALLALALVMGLR